MRKPKPPQRRTLRIISSYLYDVYDVKRLPWIVDATAKAIEKFHKRKAIDAIAFSGTSGAAVAYPLSVKMGFPLICIRKDGTESHYYSTYEGVMDVKHYIIVDDCISSGDTIRRIKKEVSNRCRSAKLKGVFLYNHANCYRKTCGGAPIIVVKPNV